LLTVGLSLDVRADHPPGPVVFKWCGTGCYADPLQPGTGNGDTGVWQNWFRVPVDTEEGFYEPWADDTLDVSHERAPDATIRRSITLSNLALFVDYGFTINADISGGNLDVNRIGIYNIPYANPHQVNVPVYYTTDFSNTTLGASQITVGSFGKPITFTGSTLNAFEVRMSGGDHYDAIPFTGGVGVTNLLAGSLLDMLTLEIGKDNIFGRTTDGSLTPYVLNVDASTIQGLGMDISGGAITHTPARVQLGNGSQANLEQFVVVGTGAAGELVLTGSSMLAANTAYVNIGDLRSGLMSVAQNSEVHAKDLNVGVAEQGTVNVDSGGKIFSTAGYLGLNATRQGTVNLEGGGRWETKDLTLGQSGTGIVNVRHNGTLKITGEGVLGQNPNSRGVLNLIGAAAHAELGPMATLTIGKEGTGELHLSEGAMYTSAGTTTLGAIAGGTGIVTVDGENSNWTVNGNLNIGDRSTGRVEIRNQGKVTATGQGIFLGTQAQGDGTLLLDGDGTTLDFDGQLFVADFGKGKVELQNGAQFSTGKLTLGQFAGSEGTLEVAGKGAMPSTFTTTGEFTIGMGGKGVLKVDRGAELHSKDDVVLANDTNSNADVDLRIVSVDTGGRPHWYIDGNLTIARRGTATVDVVGGVLDANGPILIIGEESGSNGTLSIVGGMDADGSTYSANASIAGNLRVGHAGTGIVKIEEGALQVEGLTDFGDNTTGDGKAEIKANGRLLIRGEATIGGEGKGKIEITQGGQFSQLSNRTVIDATVRDNAVISISGTAQQPSFLSSPLTIVGELGYGQLSVNAAGRVGISDLDRGDLRIAVTRTSHGIVSVSDGGIVGVVNLHAASVAGEGGDADIDITSTGKIDATGQVILGPQSGVGSADVKIDNGMLHGKQIDMHHMSTTTVSNSGKVLLKSSGALSMGGSADRPATLNVQSSAQLTAEDGATGTHLVAGATGKAIVNVNSGGKINVHQVTVASTGTQVTTTGNESFIQAGRVNVNGGTLTADAGSLIASTSVLPNSLSIGGGTLEIKGGSSLVVQGGMNITSGSATFLGGGAGDVAKSVHVNGTIDVLSGKMQIGNGAGGPPAAPSAVTVFPSGLLSGSGTIKGDLYALDPKSFPNVTGQRFPLTKLGNSPGMLTVEGNVVLELDTILQVEIGGLAAGTQYDQLVATGSIEFNGILDLAIVNSGGGFQLPNVGDDFMILSAAGGVSGTPQNSASLRSVAGGALVNWSLTPGANGFMLEAAAVTPLPTGDYNGNGVVDAADYVVWRHNVAGINLAADGNRDGLIDAADYNIWRAHFGNTAAPGAGAVASGAENAAVPEPPTCLLLVTIAVLWWQRRRNDAFTENACELHLL
jgi:T5SS/PEP-CTERM-associated repeat protein